VSAPADATAALVDVADLSIARSGRDVVRGLSFAVARGSTHAITGPNGAGKSTLLMAVLGLLPFRGRVRLHFASDARVIGYVPQRFVADRTLPVCVEDFLATTRQSRPVCFGVSSRARDKIHTMLDQVGLVDVKRRLLSALSGGQMQRLLLAHALDPLPELLLLDEPGAGMDAASSTIMEQTLASLKAQGVTSLLVSHDAAQVSRLCDGTTEIIPA
jgi:zinc transport system ATP-binding protein